MESWTHCDRQDHPAPAGYGPDAALDLGSSEDREDFAMSKAFENWMDEYRQKQGVCYGSGEPSADDPIAEDSCRQEQAQASAPLEPVQLGRATAGIYQGNSEPSADDPYYDDEPLWSDTATEIERQNSIKGR